MNLFVRRAVQMAIPSNKPALAEIPTPERLIVPLRQHLGPPCEPVVEQGQSVAEGQVIGQPDLDHADSAPIHAPAAGKIAGVVNKPVMGGQTALCVVIEPTDQPAAVPASLPAPHGHGPAGEEMFTRIADSGVVLSGGFPVPLARDMTPYAHRCFLKPEPGTDVKLIYTLIVSAVDREPLLYNQRFLAASGHPALEIGLNAIQALSCANRSVVVGGSNGDLNALAGLIHFGHRSVARIDSDQHPNGLMPVLIKKVTGDELPLPKADPRDVGVFFVRLEAAYWAGLAVALGRPQTGKWLTVVGPDGGRRMVQALIGTPVGHVLKSVGLKPQEGGKVILGGLLTGQTIYDLQTPVTKEVDGVVVLPPEQVRRFEPLPCINCGLCVQACPTRLLPGQISKYCEYGRYEEAEAADLFYCIECGLCAYVCPAKRPMIHYFRHAKEEIMARRAGQ